MWAGKEMPSQDLSRGIACSAQRRLPLPCDVACPITSLRDNPVPTVTL